MMKNLNISVVIPTLLKNTDVLFRLINTLDADSFVKEIIVINNSDKNFSHDSPKVKIVQSKANMYVNPSWNYGIKIAKYPLCALFNDDLLVCDGFCGQVARLIQKEQNFGCCGMDKNFVHNTQNVSTPKFAKASLKIDNLDIPINCWGCIIFVKKRDWVDIPDDIKIWWGDDFIRFTQVQNKRQVFKISGAPVSHLGSLSSANKNFNPIKRKDTLLYSKIDPRIKNREDYILLVQTPFQQKLRTVFHFIIRCIYQKKITSSGKVIVKILKIPVYRRKV